MQHIYACVRVFVRVPVRVVVIFRTTITTTMKPSQAQFLSKRADPRYERYEGTRRAAAGGGGAGGDEVR